MKGHKLDKIFKCVSTCKLDPPRKHLPSGVVNYVKLCECHNSHFSAHNSALKKKKKSEAASF